MTEEYLVQVFNGSDNQLIGTVRGRNQATLLGEVEKLMAKQSQTVEVSHKQEVPL